MGFIGRFLGMEGDDFDTVCVKLRKPLKSVMDTAVYLNEDEEITMDEIIEDALIEYFKKRLWLVEEKRNDDKYGVVEVKKRYEQKKVVNNEIANSKIIGTRQKKSK